MSNNDNKSGTFSKLLKATGDAAKKFGSDTAKKVSDAIGESGVEAVKKIGEAVGDSGAKAVKKIGTAIGKTGASVVEKAAPLASNLTGKAKTALESLNKQKEEIEQTGYSEVAAEKAKQVIATMAGLPGIRVDRKDFLIKTFGKSKYIDQIIEYGPDKVFKVESLRKKADEIIKNSTRKTTAASFAAGIGSNLLVMAATMTADIAQYFGFAINMAQKIAYLFGEDDLFAGVSVTKGKLNLNMDLVDKDGVALPEDAQIRILSYLGAMMGVSGAGSLILKTSQRAGASIGKKVAAQALTKTTWYPLVKKVASILGYKITKKTVESAISKTVPIIGGAISGGITYATFKPMGGRLADTFVDILNGEFDEDLDLNEEFLESLKVSSSELDDEPIEAEYEIINEEEDEIIEEVDMEIKEEQTE